LTKDIEPRSLTSNLNVGGLQPLEALAEAQRSLEALRISEEKFFKIFHLSPDAIDLTRVEDGVSLDCNQSYEKLTGYTREEIIGHSTLPGDLGVWVRKEDRDRFAAQLQAMGEVTGFETFLRRKDGSTYPALLSSTTLEINGELCNLDLTRDITEQKQAQEALRASEEKFSKTFKLSPDAISINRLKDGVYLDINQGFMEMTGYTALEVLGHSSLTDDLGLWVHPEDRERLGAMLRTQGEVTSLEAQFRMKDGSVRVGMMSARLMEIGGEPCVLSITRDITARKQAEEAARESAQRLQLALDSSHLGIWDRDLLTEKTIWDDRMFELYGLTREAYTPEYKTWIRRVVHPDDSSMVRDNLQAALDGKQPYDLKFRILRPNGEVRHIGSLGIVVRDADGKAVRVIGINQDRTEQVEAEAERRRLQAEVHQAEKLESIGSLAGGVAHDMNNVLTAILITAEMLQAEYLQDKTLAKSVAVILRAGQRGRDLVKALMDFAHKDLTETSPVDLNEILRREVELLRHTTLRKIQVVLDLDENIPVIRGAASELGSALMNLSINAVDAMPEGGTLTFRSRTLEDGWIEVTVADTGQGMAPEVLAKALDPFFTTKAVGKGTGLGLSRVYGALKAHGGTVELQSQPGRGTTVVLRLPSTTENPQEPELADAALPEALGPALHILLVDDEGIILETLPPVLTSLGHTVETASCGEEALRCLERHGEFALVILDHNMPGLSGAETLRQLRTRFPKLPVILSSGFLDAPTETLLTGVPLVWVLKKPYKMRDFQKTLAEVARLKAR